MKFTFSEGPMTVWWPYEFQMPTDGGKFVTCKIQLKFKLIDDDDYRAFLDRIRPDVDSQADLSELQIDMMEALAELQRDIIVDWKDVNDESGDPLPFTQERLGRLLQKGFFKRGLMDTYGQCRLGGAVKN